MHFQAAIDQVHDPVLRYSCLCIERGLPPAIIVESCIGYLYNQDDMLRRRVGGGIIARGASNHRKVRLGLRRRINGEGHLATDKVPFAKGLFEQPLHQHHSRRVGTPLRRPTYNLPLNLLQPLLWVKHPCGYETLIFLPRPTTGLDSLSRHHNLPLTKLVPL